MSIEGSIQHFKKSILKIAIIIGIILYTLSPIDFIPDFIPIAGWIDDLLVIVAGCSYLGYDILRLKPKARYQEARNQKE